MPVAALVAWIATAAAGLVLLGLWLGRSGPAQYRGGRSRFSPALIFSHFALAAAGLAIWIGAIVFDAHPLRWASVAVLPVVAGLGVAMFLKWLGGRGAHAGRVELDPPAEQRFPVIVVALHGTFAVATIGLAVLAATGG